MSDYIVEKILDSKLEKGKKMYKIKWKGYPVSQCTWEPVAHLSNCIDMVKDFEKELAQENAPKPTLKPAPSIPNSSKAAKKGPNIKDSEKRKSLSPPPPPEEDAI